MERRHSGSVVMLEAKKADTKNPSHGRVIRHVGFKIPGEKQESILNKEIDKEDWKTVTKKAKDKSPSAKNMKIIKTVKMESPTKMDIPENSRENGLKPKDDSSDDEMLPRKSNIKANPEAKGNKPFISTKNTITTSPVLSRFPTPRKSSMDKPGAGSLLRSSDLSMFGFGRRSSASSTASTDSTRGDRLRKSILSKSMSSLTPLYVDQILPATTHDQHMVRQSTYERTIGPGYLYVISESTETGSRGNLFKIGVTNDIKLRLRDLQNGNPRPLIPELLLKVRDMEAVFDHVEDVLREHVFSINGGRGWYKADTDADGRNAVMDMIEDVKRMHYGVEIPPDKFADYMYYYITFEC